MLWIIPKLWSFAPAFYNLHVAEHCFTSHVQLATSPEQRAKHPWIITMAHRPMYCSNPNGDTCNWKESRVSLQCWVGERDLLSRVIVMFQDAVQLHTSSGCHCMCYVRWLPAVWLLAWPAGQSIAECSLFTVVLGMGVARSCLAFVCYSTFIEHNGVVTGHPSHL